MLFLKDSEAVFEDCQVGDVCAVFVPDDDVWYRGVVRSLLDVDEEVCVAFSAKLISAAVSVTLGFTVMITTTVMLEDFHLSMKSRIARFLMRKWFIGK